MYYSKFFKKHCQFTLFSEQEVFMNKEIIAKAPMDSPDIDFDCESDIELIESA